MRLCNNPKLYKYNYVVCLYNRNGLPFNMYVLWVIFPMLNIYECLTTHDQKAIYFTSVTCCGHDGSIDRGIPGKPHMVEMMDHSVYQSLCIL